MSYFVICVCFRILVSNTLRSVFVLLSSSCVHYLSCFSGLFILICTFGVL